MYVYMKKLPHKIGILLLHLYRRLLEFHQEWFHLDLVYSILKMTKSAKKRKSYSYNFTKTFLKNLNIHKDIFECFEFVTLNQVLFISNFVFRR